MEWLLWLLGLLGIGAGAMSFLGIGLALPLLGPILMAITPIVQMVVGWVTSLLTLVFESFVEVLRTPKVWLAVLLVGAACYWVGLLEGRWSERAVWEERWAARDAAVKKALTERLELERRAMQETIAEQETQEKELSRQLSALETEKEAIQNELKNLATDGACRYRPGQRERMQRFLE